jgi:hypothetical protein
VQRLLKVSTCVDTLQSEIVAGTAQFPRQKCGVVVAVLNKKQAEGAVHSTPLADSSENKLITTARTSHPVNRKDESSKETPR